MLESRELVRVRRGRVVISQWVEQSSSPVNSEKSPLALQDLEAERGRANARASQLGAKGYEARGRVRLRLR